MFSELGKVRVKPTHQQAKAGADAMILLAQCDLGFLVIYTRRFQNLYQNSIQRENLYQVIP